MTTTMAMTQKSSLYRKTGNRFTVTTNEALNIQEGGLPTGTYSVRRNPETEEYYLEMLDCEDSNMWDLGNQKIYGSVESTANRIVNTFLKRSGKKSSTTGVLLAGEKGSGKTLLAKLVSRHAAEKHGIPTVLINEPHCGESFNKFIRMLQQPMVLLFDEFDKVYNGENYDEYGHSEENVQKSLLTLLDGIYPSRTLFLFTCNDVSKIDSHMMNRPGRIYYYLEFHGLEDSFIREYAQEELKDKTQVDMLCKVGKIFSSFNFDILQAMIEEMNLYDENPLQVLKFLNAQPKLSGTQTFQLELWVKKLQKTVESETWTGNPFRGVFTIFHERGNEDFYPEDFTRIDCEKSTYTLVNRNGARLIMKAMPRKSLTDIPLDALMDPKKSSKRRQRVTKIFASWFPPKPKKTTEDIMTSEERAGPSLSSCEESE